MAQAQTQRPEYIDLLDAVRVGEAGAGVYLKAWADKTNNQALRHCLNLVSERETSHRDIFERRIRELGYDVEQTEDPNLIERLEVLGSDAPDAEKIQWFKDALGRQSKPTVRDRFEAAIEDEGVDPLTRSLLRWFADEESDSGSLMEQAYSQAHSKVDGGS
jgi:hypothetical protein